MRNVAAFVSGLIFALGLGVAGMTKPSKVLGFLDIRGAWDPTLMFVMVGGIAVYASFYALVRRMSKPLLDESFHIPTAKFIDKKLIAGAAIFGVGWGLGGYCPGPGITALASESPSAMAFVLTMGLGMILLHVIERTNQKRNHHSSKK